MRVISLFSTVVITASLYLLVMERDALIAFASNTAPGAEAAATDAAIGANDSPPGIPVVVQRSTAQSVENAVLVRGRTEAARQVQVRAETSGLVISEPMRRGAFVNAGEPLCELAPGPRGAALREAQARLAEAEINFNAASQLSEGGFGSQTRTASAQAALQGAQAGVEATEQELSRLILLAPFDGLLESDTAELGALLQPGGLCATLIQLDPMKLVAFVPETEVDRVEIGAIASARLSTGREVMGRVSFLSRSADPATRTFRVEVLVDNADLSIRDGQSAELLIVATGVSGHLLPGSALTLNDTGVLGLRTVDATQHVVFAPVSVIRDTLDGIWVTGLDDNVDVIVVGQEFVIEGVAVDVTYRGTHQMDAAQ
jgi:multidrug efflux system membrane fusion protein